MSVIPRAAWGARHGRYALGMRTRGETVIHITVNSEISASASQAVEAAAMRGVERYVVTQRGFRGFPYSFCGFQSGRIYEGQGWGRNGSHTQKGRNRSAYALARFGHPDVQPSEAFLAGGRRLFAEGLAQGYLSPGFRISGHRDHWPKACPGTPLYVRRGELRPSHAPTIEEEDVLQRGDKGAEVTVLQWRINELLHGEADPRGAGKDYGLKADGDFGEDTEKYVRHVQAGFGYTMNAGKADAALLVRIERRLLELGRVKIPVGANGAAHTERGAD